jgi:dTDP-4-amino-4,6-dideoxygalactose transaminase
LRVIEEEYSLFMSDTSYIPFHRRSIGKEESDAVQRVLSSGWLTTGPIAIEFEKQFAAYVGCKHALAVNSCTAALQLALDAIGLRPSAGALLYFHFDGGGGDLFRSASGAV